MKTFDRRSEIIRLVREQQRTSTGSLSAIFGVSEVTIRNDLRVLSEQGWLQRVHGGAEIIAALQSEQSFSTRQHTHPTEKTAIARAALTLIHPGDTILLDSSTTAFQLAMLLSEKSLALRVVTNNLQVVAVLTGCPDIEVISLGGVVRSKTSSVVGPMAQDMLAGLYVDKGFFSASGITIERGLTDADIREVEIKRAMVQSSRKMIAMLDASKFGQQSFLTFASLKDIDHLITENDISTEYEDAFASHRIQTHIAKNA